MKRQIPPLADRARSELLTLEAPHDDKDENWRRSNALQLMVPANTRERYLQEMLRNIAGAPDRLHVPVS